MRPNSVETDELLRLAGHGDEGAIRGLLERHRGRLRGMVASRLDRRMAARVDPSDVVQEALGEASGRLAGFVREQPVPFFTWLRRLTLLHLGWSHRFHLGARKRSAAREVGQQPLPTLSASAFVLERLVDRGTTPSENAVRDEECEQVRAVLNRLESRDRSFLELRYVEGLSLPKIGERLGIGPSAVKMRHLRALRRFRGLIEGAQAEPAS